MTCSIETSRDLAELTAWKIGGPADFYAEPATPDELAFCYEFARNSGLEVLALGGASNMLIADAGFRGLVVRYADTSEAWEAEPGKAREAQSHGPDAGEPAGAGKAADAGDAANGGKAAGTSAGTAQVRLGARVLLSSFARRSARDGWSGLGWAEGIPGTIGGAVVGNAGAYGGEIAEQIVEVELYFPESGFERWSREECSFSYRSSRIKELGNDAAFVLAATLELTKGDPDKLTQEIREISSSRKSKSPTGLSCGSVFKNPPGHVSGKLIESVGLKGHVIGNARISERHGNYIVNRGGATAADVLALIREAQKRVREKYEIELELEVRLVGF